MLREMSQTEEDENILFHHNERRFRKVICDETGSLMCGPYLDSPPPPEMSFTSALALTQKSIQDHVLRLVVLSL